MLLFCSLTKRCAAMPFSVLKIVGGVGSNFGAVTFYTAADDTCCHVLFLLLPRAVCESN